MEIGVNTDGGRNRSLGAHSPRAYPVIISSLLRVVHAYYVSSISIPYKSTQYELNDDKFVKNNNW